MKLRKLHTMYSKRKTKNFLQIAFDFQHYVWFITADFSNLSLIFYVYS